MHVLQYTLGGQGLLSWGRREDGSWERSQSVNPGELFVASWSRLYEYRFPESGEPWEFRWVIIEGPLADQVLAQLCRCSPVVSLATNSASALWFENLQLRLAFQESWDRYALSSAAYELLTCLLRDTESQQPGGGDVVREAERWVMEHLSEASAADLASHFGYHPKYFAEYLRRHSGFTPQKFIEDCRMRYARILLTTTGRSIGAISAELGYAEDNYFSRVFRQHAGQSPQEYRRTHKESLVYDQIVPL
jgi:AraC-type DNA-binding domain-containing proteins